MLGAWRSSSACYRSKPWLRPHDAIDIRRLGDARLIRAFAGVYRVLNHIGRMANHRGLVWLFTSWLAVMVICSLLLYIAVYFVIFGAGVYYLVRTVKRGLPATIEPREPRLFERPARPMSAAIEQDR